jgi:hypothetical protein
VQDGKNVWLAERKARSRTVALLLGRRESEKIGHAF